MQKNSYAHRIEKEQISKLPLVAFEGRVIVVEKYQQIYSAVRYLSKQTIVGVDTETRPSFHHGENHPTALLQIATSERCYLFQLTKIGLPRLLTKIFENPQICKVGLAFKDDLRGLMRRRAFKPQNCVDIQSIVLKYGILELGLQKIYAIVFGQRISKSQQLTNWDNVVLSDEQARYAATDAWATLQIYNQLMQTEELPRRVYEALRQADLDRMRQHQQEIEESRKQESNSFANENHISEKA